VLYSYYVGLDLGQRQDYTAVAVLEEPVWLEGYLTEPRPGLWRLGLSELSDLEPGWVSPGKISPTVLERVLALNYREGRPAGAPLNLRHLQRFPLGTPYPEVVGRVLGMLSAPPLFGRRVALIVDATGVGQGVVDQLVQAGLSPLPVWIHGGDKAIHNATDGSYRVPKRDLVAAVQVLMQNSRLKIARKLKEAGTLRQELQNFRVKIDPKTAHDSYSHWREREHDDLVLATALACWFRQWWMHNIDKDNALALRR
jgi:hypothetical protein